MGKLVRLFKLCRLLLGSVSRNPWNYLQLHPIPAQINRNCVNTNNHTQISGFWIFYRSFGHSSSRCRRILIQPHPPRKNFQDVQEYSSHRVRSLKRIFCLFNKNRPKEFFPETWFTKALGDQPGHYSHSSSTASPSSTSSHSSWWCTTILNLIRFSSFSSKSSIKIYISAMYLVTASVTTVGFGISTPSSRLSFVFFMFLNMLGIFIYGYCRKNMIVILRKIKEILDFHKKRQK